MAGDTGTAGTRRSFRIHGGECVLLPTDDAVRIHQTLSRHHHPLGWTVTVAAAIGAGYGLVTGWRYTTGTEATVGWPFFLLLTGLLLAVPVWRRIVDRFEGYTSASTIQLTAIEEVTLTSTEIRWYFKTRTTVPVCVIRYRTNGETRRRRFKLPLRSGRSELQAAVDAFKDTEVQVRADRMEEVIPVSRGA